MRFKGPNPNYPCRFCQVKKHRIEDAAESGGIRLVDVGSVLNSEIADDIFEDLDWELLEEFSKNKKSEVELSEKAKGMRGKDKKLFLETFKGLKFESALRTCPGTMVVPFCVPADFMHLTYQNALRSLVSVFGGYISERVRDYNCDRAPIPRRNP